MSINALLSNTIICNELFNSFQSPTSNVSFVVAYPSGTQLTLNYKLYRFGKLNVLALVSNVLTPNYIIQAGDITGLGIINLSFVSSTLTDFPIPLPIQAQIIGTDITTGYPMTGYLQIDTTGRMLGQLVLGGYIQGGFSVGDTMNITLPNSIIFIN